MANKTTYGTHLISYDINHTVWPMQHITRTGVYNTVVFRSETFSKIDLSNGLIQTPNIIFFLLISLY